MTDNIGNYVTMQELLERLYPSTYVSYRSAMQLSDKTVDVFSFAGNTFPLAVGDIVCQGEYYTTILSFPTGKVQLADATNIDNGAVTVFRTLYEPAKWNTMVVQAMKVLDFHTGQWFNKRNFTGANSVKTEGNGSYFLHFPVPIIEINSILLNGEGEALPSSQYMVFNGRTLPDDRRNPKVKLLYGFFAKLKITQIDGSFGYLEADGSTPELIKVATSRLVVVNLLKDPTQLTTNPIKVEKTDLHEIHYAVSSEAGIATEQNAARTGDLEVDRIINMYKSPFAIGGTESTVRLDTIEYTEDMYG